MTVSFFTFGCKVNTAETQALKLSFENAGFTVILGESADVFLINTCTVTHIADRKCRNILRRLRRENPNSIIVLAGCMPQTNPSAEELTQADIILGNGEKAQALSYVLEFIKTGKRIFAVSDIFKEETFKPLEISRFDDSFQRAYLKIEDGCDCFCTYCAIGLARGRVRSASPIEVKHMAESFLQQGYRELVLTGINLSRYGADLGLRPSHAISEACSLDGDFRVRIGSVEPKLMNIEDFEVMATLPKLCPHFHLALQSGSDKTLKRMGRRYTVKEYMEFVDYIFKHFKNPSITTDLIVGFMGETQEEFSETAKLVASLPLLKANIFEYSQRSGTRAAALTDIVPPEVKKERALELTEIAQRQGAEFLKTQLKSEARVLVEGKGGGYTDNYVPVKLLTDAPVGTLQNVILKEIKGGKISAALKEKVQ